MKKTFSISKAISFGWATFKSNWKFWIMVFLLFSLGMGSGGGFNFSGLGPLLTNSAGGSSLNEYKDSTYLNNGGSTGLDQNTNIPRYYPSDDLLNMKKIENNVLGAATSMTSEKSGPTFGIAVLLIGLVVGSIFLAMILFFASIYLIYTMGYINLTLDAARNKQVYYKTLLNQVSLKKAFKLLIAQLYVGFIVMCGLILFIVPGIIFALKYVFVPYVMVDQDVPSIKGALKGSSQITKGVRGKLFGFSIVSSFVWFAGLLAFGVGTVVSAIVLSLAAAYIYKELADGGSSNQLSQDAPAIPVPPSEPTITEGSLGSLTAPSGL